MVNSLRHQHIFVFYAALTASPAQGQAQHAILADFHFLQDCSFIFQAILASPTAQAILLEQLETSVLIVMDHAWAALFQAQIVLAAILVTIGKLAQLYVSILAQVDTMVTQILIFALYALQDAQSALMDLDLCHAPLAKYQLESIIT